jgi:hypothetical protein
MQARSDKNITVSDLGCSNVGSIDSDGQVGSQAGVPSETRRIVIDRDGESGVILRGMMARSAEFFQSPTFKIQFDEW